MRPSHIAPVLAAFAALLLVAPGRAAGPTTRNMDVVAHFDEYSQGPTAYNYASCWSYVHPDGREYAAIGTWNGTAIYNVSNPNAVVRVGFIPGPVSIWRELKSYRNWIYVVTEGTGAGLGLQIIRMTNPDAPVLATTWTGTFVRSHTVSVDTSRALLVCNGTRNALGQATGMRILSLAAPESPVEVGWWPGGLIPVIDADYVHDCVPIGNRLYASSIYSGFERILDITSPSAPLQLTAWTYPGAFTHNSWPDATGRWLYATDEINGRPLRVFDISNLGFPLLVNNLTSNPQAIVHNAHVRGSELYLANYTEGVRVLDLSDPVHPAEYAWADSWPGASGGYYGVWGVCPYFPSGLVIASDIQTGLYVYRPRRDYGLLRVQVQLPPTPGRRPQHEGGGCGAACSCPGGTCSGGACSATCGCSTGLPPSGAGFTVTLLAPGDSLVTTDDGVVVFAADQGQQTIRVRRFGYYDETLSWTVANGRADTVAVRMRARARVDFTGIVTDASSGLPLADAEVAIAATPLHAHTDSAGACFFPQVPDDFYSVSVHRPGYVPYSVVRRIGPDMAGLAAALVPARAWEPMENDPGFAAGAPPDDATSGHWVRVEPLGTGLTNALAPATGSATASGPATALATAAARASLQRSLAGSRFDRNPRPMHEGREADGITPGDVQPEFDRTPGLGTMCWVTGQGAAPGSVDEADVDGGQTTLTSRAFDLSTYADPVIGYWRWFFTSTPADVNDALQIRISADGGASWTSVETIHGDHAHWEEAAIRVADHVTPGADVRVQFIASDRGDASVVEAAIDDLALYENGSTATLAPRESRLTLRAPWPNPSRGDLRLSFALRAPGEVDVAVLDVQGRIVRVLAHDALRSGWHELRWDGLDERGHESPAGLYFARVRAAGEESRARVVRVR